MINAELPLLGIKIILKCHKKPVSMHEISQFFKIYDKEERDIAISNLLKHKLIEEKKMPKPNTKKTPTYYFITSFGRKWVEEYLKFFKK